MDPAPRRGGTAEPDGRRSVTRNRRRRSGTDRPSLSEFAIGLHEARKGETSQSNHEFMGWCLRHAVPYFGDWPLDEIDIPAVDEFRRHLVDVSAARRRALESGRPMRNKHGQALRPSVHRASNKVIMLFSGCSPSPSSTNTSPATPRSVGVAG